MRLPGRLRELVGCAGVVPACVRVSAIVSFAESAGTDMSVDLGRRQALVSEQFLDTAEVGSAVEHVTGEAVSESVW